jgi:APA family basic amino acid/polyamine antiporter
VLSSTGWWFILALWAPIYGAIFKLQVVQPLAALLGLSSDAQAWIAGPDGTFAVSIVTIIIACIAVALGMAGYARIQRWCIWIGLVMLGLMFVVMLLSSSEAFHAAFDKANQALFGVSNAYQATIDNAVANDSFVTGGTTSPLDFGLSSGTWLLLPLMMFWILYPNWGATLYGEVRGAGDFRKVLNGMLGGLWVTIALAIVFVILAAKTFGWDFFNATNVNFINNFYGYVSAPPATPIWSYPPLLVSYLIDSRIVQIAVVAIFGVWFIGWAGTLWLSSTRMIFAAAFDRVLPEWAGRVDERRGVPYFALALIAIPGLVLSWLYAYSKGFSALTLDASLVIAVTFFGTTFAATILPWWKKDLYQKSPIARYQVAGIPLISIAGAIITVFLAFVIYEWLANPLYAIGVGNVTSMQFLAILYGLAAVVYVVARLWRRAQGINLDAIHAEIPAE